MSTYTQYMYENIQILSHSNTIKPNVINFSRNKITVAIGMTSLYIIYDHTIDSNHNTGPYFNSSR